MSTEQRAVMMNSKLTEQGNVAIVGLKRRSHEGWQAVTTTFADQVATEVLGYRLGGSDETIFGDVAQLAGEQPPLSTEDAGIVYAAVHMAINARQSGNQGANS